MPDRAPQRVIRQAARTIAGVMAGLIVALSAGHAQEPATALTTEPVPAATAEAPPDLFPRAYQAIQQGRADDAYQILAPYEAQLAGDTNFDYLFGIAALDSGRASESVLILERVVASDPGYSGARMELARAHFESGDNERARVHFEQLQQESPPPTASDAISAYLAAIDQRAASYQTRWTPYVDLAGGYDSNANASTNEQNFLGFSLSNRNVEQSSSFLAAAIGGQLSKPIKPDLALVAEVEVGHRYNADASYIDNTVGRGFIGLNHEFGANVFKAAVGGYWSALDGDYNESGVSLDLEWSRTLTESWLLTGVVRGGAVRFDDMIDVMDVNRILLAIRALRRTAGAKQGVFSVSLIGGEDFERENSSPYGNTKWGARVGGAWSPTGRSRISIDVGALTSDYNGDFFGMPREDTQISAVLGLSWQSQPGRGWILNPFIRYVQNDSDIDLYEYDRYEIALGVRREF